MPKNCEKTFQSTTKETEVDRKTLEQLVYLASSVKLLKNYLKSHDKEVSLLRTTMDSDDEIMRTRNGSAY